MGGESKGYIGNSMVTNTRLDRLGSLSGDSKEMVSFKKSDMQFLLQLPKRSREILGTGYPGDTRDEGSVLLLPLEDKGQMHPNQQMKCRRENNLSSNKLRSLDVQAQVWCLQMLFNKPIENVTLNWQYFEMACPKLDTFHIWVHICKHRAALSMSVFLKVSLLIDQSPVGIDYFNPSQFEAATSAHSIPQ